jgi:hypothetical protein
MKEMFRDKRFSGSNLILLAQTYGIIENYESQGITMTLRQLYYQLVAAAIIPNTLRAYKHLTNLITDARYAGAVDWDSIEDNLRKPRMPSTFRDIPEILEAAISSYKLDYWKDMKTYVELYTEKDALSSILGPIAVKHRIPFQVNRGYASASSMYEAANRFKAKEDKVRVILYLGDHDPSGLDMVRDIRIRLNEFGVDAKVEHIGLTWDQIEMYKPPPNPAKITDSRSASYIRKWGDESWEVDALPPDVMIKIVKKAIAKYEEPKAKALVLEQERLDIEDLENFRNERIT